MLPAELINNISQYLDDTDFVSLRNTCKKHRDIAYYPKRQIISGIKSRSEWKLRPNKYTFSMVFLTMTFISMMFLIVSIIGLSIGYDKEHMILGTTLLVLSLILLFLDALFVLICIKVRIIKEPFLIYV